MWIFSEFFAYFTLYFNLQLKANHNKNLPPITTKMHFVTEMLHFHSILSQEFIIILITNLILHNETTLRNHAWRHSFGVAHLHMIGIESFGHLKEINFIINFSESNYFKFRFSISENYLNVFMLLLYDIHVKYPLLHKRLVLILTTC